MTVSFIPARAILDIAPFSSGRESDLARQCPGAVWALGVLITDAQPAGGAILAGMDLYTIGVLHTLDAYVGAPAVLYVDRPALVTALKAKVRKGSVWVAVAPKSKSAYVGVAENLGDAQANFETWQQFQDVVGPGEGALPLYRGKVPTERKPIFCEGDGLALPLLARFKHLSKDPAISLFASSDAPRHPYTVLVSGRKDFLGVVHPRRGETPQNITWWE